jgi:hypothetical protein
VKFGCSVREYYNWFGGCVLQVSRVKIGTREEKEALSTSTVAPTSLLSDLVGDLSTDGVSGQCTLWSLVRLVLDLVK